MKPITFPTFGRCVESLRFRLTFGRCAEVSLHQGHSVSVFLLPLHLPHFRKVCRIPVFSPHLRKVCRIPVFSPHLRKVRRSVMFLCEYAKYRQYRVEWGSGKGIHSGGEVFRCQDCIWTVLHGAESHFRRNVLLDRGCILAESHREAGRPGGRGGQKSWPWVNAMRSAGAIFSWRPRMPALT